MTDTSRREQFIESLKKGLDELNEELARLEQRAGQARGELEKQYQAQLAELREQRAEMKGKLADIRAASEAQFEKLKLEAEHAWKAFRNSVHYFQSHFK